MKNGGSHRDDTRENVRRTGLVVERVEALAATDLVRLIIACPG
jgi:hypothetical protein